MIAYKPPTPSNAPALAVVPRIVPETGAVGRFCALCGTDIAAMRAGTIYCTPRCAKRASRGMAPAPKVRTYGTTLAHPGYSVERCPRCDFPEADGGYCAACGWTLPRPGTPGGWTLHPAGSVHGPIR